MIIIEIEFAYKIIIIKTNLNQNILQYELKSCDGFFSLIRFFMQHRFYGKSVPFISSKDALKNVTLRGYFNSGQALADYANILLHIKENLSAEMSPIIVVGASYGGSTF